MINTTNQKILQKRKLLVMLPILTIPFLTLTFWAMGGGSGTGGGVGQSEPPGINQELPGIASNSVNIIDKLGHYKKSKSDSARFLQQVKNDPYYQMAFNPEPNLEQGDTTADAEMTVFGNTPLPEYQDDNERLVMERLEALNRTLDQPKSEVQQLEENRYSVNPTVPQADLSSDLDRLDYMMQQMQIGNEKVDPEIQQMSELLDQILDIQHPDRVQERILTAKNVHQSKAFSLSKTSNYQAISNLVTTGKRIADGSSVSASNGFYGLDNNEFQNSIPNSIKAVIHETQQLISGATVKLRLTEETKINGLVLPKDQLVFGTATLNGERLIIEINHIRVHDQILPVALSVHDADGMAGIHIPGSITREVGAQSGDRAIQGLGISTFDTSLEAQAASAGIETAKSFLGKKIKQVKVTLKAGYQVWLNDENENQII